MQSAAPPKLTSTQEIALAIAQVKGENKTEDDIRREWGGNNCPGYPEQPQQPEGDNSRICAAIENLCNQHKADMWGPEPSP